MHQNVDYYSSDHKHPKHNKHDKKCKCRKCNDNIIITSSSDCGYKYDSDCGSKCAYPAIQNPCAYKTSKGIYKDICYNAKTNKLCYYNGCEWCVINTNIISGCGNPNELCIPYYGCSSLLYVDLLNFRLYICDCNNNIWVEPKGSNIPLVNRPQVLYSTDISLDANTFLKKFPYFRTVGGNITVAMPTAAALVNEIPNVQSYDTLDTYMAIDAGGNSVTLIPGAGLLFNGSTTMSSGDNVRTFIVQFINVSPGSETIMIY